VEKAALPSKRDAGKGVKKERERERGEREREREEGGIKRKEEGGWRR